MTNKTEEQGKTPKDYVHEAFSQGDGKKIKTYLNRYFKINGFYREANEQPREKVEGERTPNTAGGDKQDDRQTDMDRIEKEAKEIFGI